MLKVTDLHVYYGNIHAIKGISFVVNKGEIVTLIGSNGAGKSTILKTLSNLHPSSKGMVEFNGINTKNLAPHQLVEKGMAHVMEGRRIFPQLTVLENLEMGAYTLKDRKEINRLMANVFEHFPRLKERIHQVGGTLSGGEQQMLAIGRALMSKPSLILLDEPSMGLAPLLVDEIFKIIKEINLEHQTTILLVEQNAHRALEISHRAYVLETGEIVLSGPSQEVAHNPKVIDAYLST